MKTHDSKKKMVVFIETNFSGLYAIEYCHRQNYEVILITDNYDRFKKWFPESVLGKLDLVDKIITVSNSSDVAEVSEVIKNQLSGIDALITFAEIRTKTVAMICSKLGLKGSNVAAIEIAQDKYRFREVLRKKGVEDVGCIKIDQKEMYRLDEMEINFPCFVKPIHGHSSIGASVCQNAHDIRKTLRLLAKTSEDCVSTGVVVEDYLVGNLVSVEILTTKKGEHQIVGISDRDIINQSIEVGASFPLLDYYQDAIEKKTCAALDAIGYDFGASHVELILTKNGPYLVEVNTRVGGSGHSVMLDLATSRSIVGDCVELSLGQLIPKKKLYEPTQGSAWSCFVYPPGGNIKSLPSIESIMKLTGITDIWFHHNIGDEVEQLHSNFNWIAQVMCTGRDRVDAKKNATAAIDFIAENAVIK